MRVNMPVAALTATATIQGPSPSSASTAAAEREVVIVRCSHVSMYKDGTLEI